MTAGEPRALSPAAAATILCAMLGLEPGLVGVGDVAAALGRTLPPIDQTLDSEGFIAWCLTGLVIFEGAPPSTRVAVHEAQRVVMVLAMLRTRGNITHAARALDTSRRRLRETLRSVGLYPWPGIVSGRGGGGDTT